MGPKKVTADKKRMMSIEMKQELIKLHEKRTRVIELARMYERSTSTICTILKQKDIIKSAIPAKGTTVLSQLRTSVHEEMERLLLIWIKEKELAGDTITEAIISAKARAIFSDLKNNQPSTSEDQDEFKGSHGWFEKFRKRTGIHSVVRHGEASSADTKAVDKFITHFAMLVEEEGYVSLQIFNCDETGLFWKKMPRRTYITAEEKHMPGHKPMKDRLTLALCANASGDCKVKPLLVYHSENPRAFKTHKILKEKLHVMWRSNARAWVTRQFFVDWVNLAFSPTVKQYLLSNNLPLRALLLLDNAPGHPPALQDDILEEFQFIKVVFLPPNTTSILQPMDQQVISNFNKLYTKHLFCRCFDVTENTNLTLREFWKDHFNIVSCLNMIDFAWQEVSRRKLNSAWKKLWPAAVEPSDSGGVGDETDMPLEEIVSLGKSMSLEVDEGNIMKLVEEHEETLSTEDLKALHEMQQTEMSQEMSGSEEEVQELQESIPTSEIKSMLAQWENVTRFIEKNHPEKVATSRSAALFNDTSLTHFRNILKSRQKQMSLDKFLKKRTAPSEDAESAAKKANTND
ncbi:tigger transposable element-derived protein 1-like [Leptodactylus fuscus]